MYAAFITCALASCQADTGGVNNVPHIQEKKQVDYDRLQQELAGCNAEVAKLYRQLDSLQAVLEVEKNRLELLKSKPSLNIQEKREQKQTIKEQATQVQVVKNEMEVVQARIDKLNEYITTLKIHLDR